MGYPQTIALETEDGYGEAVKDAQGEPWHVMLPGGDFHFYGTSTQVNAEAKKRDAAWRQV